MMNLIWINKIPIFGNIQDLLFKKNQPLMDELYYNEINKYSISYINKEIDNLINTTKENISVTEKITYFFRIGECYSFLQQFNESIYYFNNSINLCEMHGHDGHFIYKHQILLKKFQSIIFKHYSKYYGQNDKELKDKEINIAFNEIKIAFKNTFCLDDKQSGGNRHFKIFREYYYTMGIYYLYKHKLLLSKCYFYQLQVLLKDSIDSPNHSEYSTHYVENIDYLIDSKIYISRINSNFFTCITDEIRKISLDRLNHLSCLMKEIGKQINLSEFKTPVEGTQMNSFRYFYEFYTNEEITVINSWFKIGFFHNTIINMYKSIKENEYKTQYEDWWSGLNSFQQQKILFYKKKYDNVKINSFDFNQAQNTSDKYFLIQFWLFKEFKVEPFILVDELEPTNYCGNFEYYFLNFLENSNYINIYDKLYTSSNLIPTMRNQWDNNESCNYNIRDKNGAWLKSTLLKNPTVIFNNIINDLEYILPLNWVIFMIQKTQKSNLLCKAVEINLLKYGLLKKLEIDYENNLFEIENNMDDKHTNWGVNWSHFNDQLDMDQQDPDFYP